MINKELYDKLKSFSLLKKISTSEAQNMESLIRTWIYKDFLMCTKCPTQIRHGQKIISNFLDKVEVIEEEPIIDTSNIDIDVDVEEAQRVGCTKCKSKRRVKK